MRGGREGGVDVALERLDPRRRLAGRVERAHLAEEVPAARDLRRVAVDDLQRRGRLDRVVLLRGDDREQIAPPHHPRIADAGDRALVDRDDPRERPVAVGALAERPHEPRVQHPRDPDVVDVDVGARHLRRDVEPRGPRDPDERVGETASPAPGRAAEAGREAWRRAAARRRARRSTEPAAARDDAARARVSEPTGTPSLAAASPSSACAPRRRRCEARVPAIAIELLPKVPPVSGLTFVS